MTVKAYVLFTEDDEALTVVRRKSKCTNCSIGCEGCGKAKSQKVVAKNTANAKSGDFVLLRYAKVNAASLAVYVLPIVLAVVVYFMMRSANRDYAEIVSFIVLISAFIAIYLVIGTISQRFGKPEIIEVLSENEHDE